MEFQIALRYLPEFWRGIVATFWLSLATVCFGTFVGLLAVPFRIWPNRVVRWLAWIVINPFRILPVLVLLVWGFYAFPLLVGRTFRVDAWWVAVIALGLNMGGFCAELFRSAVEEVPAEHVQAARSLGMSWFDTFRHVVIPLAYRNARIPYLNQVLQTIKLTVLAAIISVREIYHVTADVIQQTNHPLEMYTVLALLLFVPLLVCTVAIEWMESRTRARAGRRTWQIGSRS